MKTGRNNIGRPSMRWLRPLLGACALLVSPMVMATNNCDGNSGSTAALGAFVCGDSNFAAGNSSVAVGNGNNASGDGSVVLGRNSGSTSKNNVAIGIGAKNDSKYSIAIGTISAPGAETIIGSGAEAAVAIGPSAVIAGGAVDSVAIGNGSKVNPNVTGAVALGAGAVATQSNTVSVGDTGSEKRIVNVAAGAADTDAVNKSQLDSAIAGVTAAVGGAAATAQATANVAQGTANVARAEAATALGNAAAAQTTADTALDMASNSAHYVEGGQTLGLNANDGLGTRVANVAAGTAAMDAVNFSQLQVVMTQLIQSGLCTVSGATVQCGAAAASNAIQTGVGASVAAGADNAVAIGHNASVQSAGGVAIGDGANAVLSNSVAIGAGATALSSVAVGSGAQALGTNTTALGDDALAAGHFGVAVGNNAQALHANAVALGNGSVTSAAHTVSVGAPGAERRITQVAAPVEASDAATKGYVDGQLGRVATAFEQSSKIARRHAAQGIAATAALMNVAPSAVGRTVIGLATGHYDGSTALGLSVAHAPRADVQLNGGLAATSGGRPVVRLGMALEF